MGLRSISLVIVIPVLNEAGQLAPLLEYLKPMRSQVLFVDGGSSDTTKLECERMGFRFVESPAGRARQMNHGAKHVEADFYWFLHADCMPPDNAVRLIHQAAAEGYSWGRFDVRLTGSAFLYRIIGVMMNWRSCVTQVATGDQGLFVSRELFAETGGFPDMPLMEDIAISKLLREHSRGACVRSPLQVSTRRWDEKGIVRTMLQMWWLRLRYFLGTDPVTLHREYYGN